MRVLLVIEMTFRPWKIDEPLLPPVVQEFAGEDHLAGFVLSLVRDDIALVEITSSFLLLRHLLLAPHCRGVPRARGFDEHCGFDAPDFRTISESQAAFEGAERAVHANPASVRNRRLGEARACCARRLQDQSQRLEAQTDEL
jgi:hypothetical protein